MSKNFYKILFGLSGPINIENKNKTKKTRTWLKTVKINLNKLKSVDYILYLIGFLFLLDLNSLKNLSFFFLGVLRC